MSAEQYKPRRGTPYEQILARLWRDAPMASPPRLGTSGGDHLKVRASRTPGISGYSAGCRCDVCCEAWSEYQAAYRAEHGRPESDLRASRRWKERNRERNRARDRAYRRARRQRVAA